MKFTNKQYQPLDPFIFHITVDEDNKEIDIKSEDTYIRFDLMEAETFINYLQRAVDELKQHILYGDFHKKIRQELEGKKDELSKHEEDLLLRDLLNSCSSTFDIHSINDDDLPLIWNKEGRPLTKQEIIDL